MKVTFVPAHTGFLLATILTEAVTDGLTVIVIAFDVAGDPDRQADSPEVITTVILSLFDGIYVKVGLSVPTMLVPLYHWYDGCSPPLVGVAVKITFVPEQTGLASAAIATEAVSDVLTVIVTRLEVAGVPDRPGVITTEITSPFTGTQENAGMFSPTGVPFWYHW